MDRIVIILLVLHVMTALLYAWDWHQSYGRWQESLIRLVISLCLPLLGVLLCKLVDFFAETNASAQMDELYLGRGEMLDELELLRPVDLAQEVDKAPALDVLKMEQYSQRRKLIMDTLRQGDTLEYLSILQYALSNEDQETSHYASTVIMDLQKHVQEGLAQRQRAYQENPKDPTCQAALEQELHRSITSGVFDKNTLSQYRARYIDLSDQLLAGGQVREEWYHNRIQIDLQIGDNLHAKELSQSFVQDYPDSEDAVVDRIQVFIRMADRQELDGFLGELKNMPVMLTSKSLPYIRFLS